MENNKLEREHLTTYSIYFNFYPCNHNLRRSTTSITTFIFNGKDDNTNLPFPEPYLNTLALAPTNYTQNGNYMERICSCPIYISATISLVLEHLSITPVTPTRITPPTTTPSPTKPVRSCHYHGKGKGKAKTKTDSKGSRFLETRTKIL